MRILPLLTFYDWAWFDDGFLGFFLIELIGLNESALSVFGFGGVAKAFA